MGLLGSLFGDKSSDKAYEKAQQTLDKLFASLDRLDPKDLAGNSKAIQQIVSHVTQKADFDPQYLQNKAIEGFEQRVLRGQNAILAQSVVNRGIGGILQSENVSPVVKKNATYSLKTIATQKNAAKDLVRISAFDQMAKAYALGAVPMHKTVTDALMASSRLESNETLRTMIANFCKQQTKPMLQGIRPQIDPSADIVGYDGEDVTLQMGASLLRGDLKTKEDILNGIDFIMERMKREEDGHKKTAYIEVIGEGLLSGRLKDLIYDKETMIEGSIGVKLEDKVLQSISDVATTNIPRLEQAQNKAREYVCAYLIDKGEALTREEKYVLDVIGKVGSPEMKKSVGVISEVLGAQATTSRNTRDLAEIQKNSGFWLKGRENK